MQSQKYQHEYERDIIPQTQKAGKYIHPFRSTVTYIQGNKGSGKSATEEYISIVNYNRGHTNLDILGADNYENLFYAICLNCKAYWEKQKKEKKPVPRLHCECEKRYKILVVVPDYVKIEQEYVDAPLMNHKYLTKGELIEQRQENGETFIEYDPKRLPLNPDYTEWFKFIHIPIPNKGFKNQDKFVDVLTRAILMAHDERRILVFNPVFTKDKKHKFKIIEHIIREMGKIIRTHLKPHTGLSVARERAKTNPLVDPKKPVPFTDWTPLEKNTHRASLFLREFGSVAPSGLKGEADETLVKKALLNIIRVVRQYRISLVADFQRHADVIASIRDQRDYFFWKTTNPDMFPMDQYKWLWDLIEKEHERMENEIGTFYADIYAPRIDDLDYDEMYVLYPKKDELGNRYIKTKAILPDFHHRQENDDFELITGFKFGEAWNFVTKNEDGILIDSEKDNQKEDKALRDADMQRLFETADKLMKPTDPNAIKMKYQETFNHLRTLNLIPEEWKDEQTLRTFMSRMKRKIKKGTSETK